MFIIFSFSLLENVYTSKLIEINILVLMIYILYLLIYTFMIYYPLDCELRLVYMTDILSININKIIIIKIFIVALYVFLIKNLKN